MRNVFWYFSWILLAIGSSLTSLAIYKIYTNQSVIDSYANNQVGPVIGQTLNPADVVLDLPKEKVIVETKDGRPEALKNFIIRHNPKLLAEEPNLHIKLVEIADNYNLDFRLLPAISMKESGFCKVIPENSFNCLGLGVHSKGTWRFESYTENFDTAARVLKKNYIDKGLITPQEIMTKYTPNSPNGEWAKGVNQFMSEIKYNDRVKGIQDQETNMAIPQ